MKTGRQATDAPEAVSYTHLLNNKINETNRRMEDGQKKTEELLEKKMAIMKEDLSAELGIKIAQTNKKIDEINAK